MTEASALTFGKHDLVKLTQDPDGALWRCLRCKWKWSGKSRPSTDCPGLRRFKTWDEAGRIGLLTEGVLRKRGKLPGGAPQGVVYSPMCGWMPLYPLKEATERPVKRRPRPADAPPPPPRLAGRWWILADKRTKAVQDANTDPVHGRPEPRLPRLLPRTPGVQEDLAEILADYAKWSMCPQIGTTFREVWIVALPATYRRERPPQFADLAIHVPQGMVAHLDIFDPNPYDALPVVETMLPLLPLDAFGCPVRVLTHVPSKFGVDSAGVVRSRLDMERHSDLGEYDWGDPLQRLIRCSGQWFPEEIVGDWSPKETKWRLGLKEAKQILKQMPPEAVADMEERRRRLEETGRAYYEAAMAPRIKARLAESEAAHACQILARRLRLRMLDDGLSGLRDTSDAIAAAGCGDVGATTLSRALHGHLPDSSELASIEAWLDQVQEGG